MATFWGVSKSQWSSQVMWKVYHPVSHPVIPCSTPIIRTIENASWRENHHLLRTIDLDNEVTRHAPKCFLWINLILRNLVWWVLLLSPFYRWGSRAAWFWSTTLYCFHLKIQVLVYFYYWKSRRSYYLCVLIKIKHHFELTKIDRIVESRRQKCYLLLVKNLQFLKDTFAKTL